MNFILKTLVFMGLLLMPNLVLGQEKPTKMYDYEFTGILNPDQLEMLRNEVSNMRFVTKAKIMYKSEKSAGQIRVFTNEYFIDRDTDFEFNIYDLKMLIAKFNLTPGEYRFEPISK